MAERVSSPGPRFALAKFRPAALPSSLVARSVLHDRLTAGAGQQLTVVVGPAGAGKSVLLSSWAAAKPAGVVSWLSCDEADADPGRFWVGLPDQNERHYAAFQAAVKDGTAQATTEI
jgi:LuxR family maltose regulon positive regulatory protein